MAATVNGVEQGGCFRVDAVIQHDAGTVFAQGAKAIRAHFGGFLPHSSTVHSEIRGRLHAGAWGVQAEHVRGVVEGGTIVTCLGL